MGICYLSTETVTCLGENIYIYIYISLTFLVFKHWLLGTQIKGWELLSISHLAFLVLFDYLYTERVDLYILVHRKILKDKNPQSNFIDCLKETCDCGNCYKRKHLTGACLHFQRSHPLSGDRKHGSAQADMVIDKLGVLHPDPQAGGRREPRTGLSF